MPQAPHPAAPREGEGAGWDPRGPSGPEGMLVRRETEAWEEKVTCPRCPGRW